MDLLKKLQSNEINSRKYSSFVLLQLSSTKGFHASYTLLFLLSVAPNNIMWVPKFPIW
ncbi:uncharacterized protein CANTADRAFT_27593 [Suhomyces tanzawaensis NRRL Y-17324]|uniref:Uncharacterized protein n=1 Tax=Suhomyces tanzawaensis NRRL Y-17324 TaxID=984487 RepID=A0A1E4SBF4_9ASCO|nr:uncharacterized protein CANTADRAFT_27593 [Suhomyces tanzawaensis NRRL Y-17324]ODV76833.1 hypothetical protein CANTADRAFT_27593 [Suhomyces tanzawaensis NRRL Y-17324]